MGPTVWSHENRVSKEGMAGNERQSQVRNPVLAKDFYRKISTKVYLQNHLAVDFVHQNVIDVNWKMYL